MHNSINVNSNTSICTTICNKQDILLKLDKTSGIYSLEFKCHNNRFNFDQLLSPKLYDLMEKLNPDLIEKIHILNIHSDNEIDVLFVFKRIGAELGLSQKYMAMKTIKNEKNNNFYFKSTNINYSNSQSQNLISNKMEPIICDFAEMIIHSANNIVGLKYDFKITTKDDLPLYMENYLGLMMKKIFYNLKVFIDNFNNNYR